MLGLCIISRDKILELVINSFVNADFIKIFLTVFAISFLYLVCKCIIRSNVFRVSGSSDAAEKRAAKFECLRLGLELSILGLVAAFEVCEVAVHGSGSGKATDVQSIERGVSILQFGLVAAAVYFLSVFDSPELSFKRGIFLPNLIGWISVMISAGLFFALISGH